MGNQIQMLRRRIEHYLRNNNPKKIIQVADFLRTISDDEKDMNLLQVSDGLRKQYQQPRDKSLKA